MRVPSVVVRTTLPRAVMSRVSCWISPSRAVSSEDRAPFSSKKSTRMSRATTVFFAVACVAIFSFAFVKEGQAFEDAAAGILWIAIAFAGTLGLNRSLSMEKDQGCLDGLLLAPVDRAAIYFGKAISNLSFMLIVEAIVLPVYSFLYGVNLFNPGLLGIILLGSIGYTAVGTLLATMSVQTRTRDVLLPILLFPVVLPVLIASVKASGAILAGDELASVMPWLNLLVVYDVIFIAVAFMGYEYVVQE